RPITATDNFKCNVRYKGKATVRALWPSVLKTETRNMTSISRFLTNSFGNKRCHRAPRFTWRSISGKKHRVGNAHNQARQSPDLECCAPIRVGEERADGKRCNNLAQIGHAVVNS